MNERRLAWCAAVACAGMACGAADDQAPPAGPPQPGPPAVVDPGPENPAPAVDGTTALIPTAIHVDPCAENATVVADGTSQFVAGGGRLAYVKDGKPYVLSALGTSPIQVGNELPYQLAVDDNFALLTLGQTDQTLKSVNLTTGATVALAHAYWIGSPAVVSHRAYWWIPTKDLSSWTLWTAPADGSASATAIVTQTGDSNLNVHDDTLGWLDDAHVLWTMPALGGARTRQADLKDWTGLVFTDTTVYYTVRGAPAAGSRFTPFSIVSQPLAGGDVSTFADSLPANYPATGTEGNGPAGPVIGRKRLFWGEWWGNGGLGPNGAGLVNWKLRAVPLSGGTPQTLDAFQWSAGALTSGSAPTLAADSVAVYWTHEGTLLRLCE